MERLNDNEEQQAQSLACSHLVRGCEDAVSDLVVATGEVGEESAITQRAHVILAQVLSSWREALEALRPGDLPAAVATAAESLDAWTSEELFDVAVKRRADDASALWLMHGTLLRALVAAHDAAVRSTRRPKLVPA